MEQNQSNFKKYLKNKKVILGIIIAILFLCCICSALTSVVIFSSSQFGFNQNINFSNIDTKLQKYDIDLDDASSNLYRNASIKVSSSEEVVDIIEENQPKVERLSNSREELKNSIKEYQNTQFKNEKIKRVEKYLNDTEELCILINESHELDKAFVKPLEIYYGFVLEGYTSTDPEFIKSISKQLNEQLSDLEKLNIKSETLKKSFEVNKKIFSDTSKFFDEISAVYSSSDNVETKTKRVGDITDNFNKKIAEFSDDQDRSTNELVQKIKDLRANAKSSYENI